MTTFCEPGTNSNTWGFGNVPGKALGQLYAPGECKMSCADDAKRPSTIICHSCCADIVYDSFKNDAKTPCEAADIGRGCWRPFGADWRKDLTVLGARAAQPNGSLEEPMWKSGDSAPVKFQAWAATSWPHTG